MPAGVTGDRAIVRHLGSQFPAHWLAQVQRNPGTGPVVVSGGPGDSRPLEVESDNLFKANEANLERIFPGRVQQDRLILLCKSVMGDDLVACGRGGENQAAMSERGLALTTGCRPWTRRSGTGCLCAGGFVDLATFTFRFLVKATEIS